PGSADTEIPHVAFHVGLEELSLRTLESARKRNPTSRNVRDEIIQTLVYSGRWVEALQRSKDLNVVAVGTPPVEALLPVGRVDEAVQWVFAADPEGEVLPDPPLPIAALTLATAGRRDEAAFIASFFERGYPLSRGTPAHHEMHTLAATQALLGHPRQAVAWLRKAAHWGLPNYPLFLRDPFLDSLRSDPEFIELMAGLKADWERRLREYQ